MRNHTHFSIAERRLLGFATGGETQPPLPDPLERRLNPSNLNQETEKKVDTTRIGTRKRVDAVRQSQRGEMARAGELYLTPDQRNLVYEYSTKLAASVQGGEKIDTARQQLQGELARDSRWVATQAENPVFMNNNTIGLAFGISNVEQRDMSPDEKAAVEQKLRDYGTNLQARNAKWRADSLASGEGQWSPQRILQEVWAFKLEQVRAFNDDLAMQGMQVRMAPGNYYMPFTIALDINSVAADGAKTSPLAGVGGYSPERLTTGATQEPAESPVDIKATIGRFNDNGIQGIQRAPEAAAQPQEYMLSRVLPRESATKELTTLLTGAGLLAYRPAQDFIKSVAVIITRNGNTPQTLRLLNDSLATHQQAVNGKYSYLADEGLRPVGMQELYAAAQNPKERSDLLSLLNTGMRKTSVNEFRFAEKDGKLQIIQAPTK